MKRVRPRSKPAGELGRARVRRARPRRARRRRPPSAAHRADGREGHRIPARLREAGDAARRRRAGARRRLDRAGRGRAGSADRDFRAAARSTPCGSPGISATATPTCRSSATRSASAAITCWRRCCAASARMLAPLEAPFDPEAGAPHGHMGTIMARKKSACGSRLLRSSPRERATPEASERAKDDRIPAIAAKPALRATLSQDDGETAAASALYRLMAWLSPAFPVGAFSYSSGIEWAVEAGDIKDAETLQGLARASCWPRAAASATRCCSRMRIARRAAATTRRLRAVAELAAAFAPSKERHLETTAQGNAFVEATRAAWPCAALDRLKAVWDGPVAYPVAVAVAAAGHGIALEPALAAYPASRRRQLGLRRRAADPARPDATASACWPRWSRSSPRPRSARSRPRSTISARPPSAPTSPARGTRRSTRGCSGAER